MKKMTISIRVTQEQKQILEKIGNGSISKGFSAVFDNCDLKTIAADSSQPDSIEQLKKIHYAIDELENGFWSELDEGKAKIARLREEYANKKKELLLKKEHEISDQLERLTY